MTDRLNDYQRTAILSASPAQLLTMLYDRLLLDLHRAEQAQLAERWGEASTQLLHAQDIVSELQRTLDVRVWDGASRLMAIYDYVYQSLVRANISRDVELTRECQARLEPLRQAWHEAAAMPVAAPAGGVARVG
ncbi:flagellar export chaperone FliS [Agromyces mediolanus]|uniref:flagellar export chaperone FliS n=1 Tax=Agromyces mediolanus TaxID=41986 RepID=UPI0020400108|nr:flagellar export chaperone FliS [Agromyces mediolanus]MCM3657486.1 flagellar export chaperone FliS [Agromyces mediolanus]